MRIVDYQSIKVRQRRRQAKKRLVRRGFILLVTIVFMASSAYISYQIPLPVAEAAVKELNTEVSIPTSIAWPGYGQAALGNPEYGVLETNGGQEAAPTASVAKIMTALAVLRKKPIVKDQLIPRLVIDEIDVASYNFHVNNDGSNVRVELGEELTEYQALQALLLPSANNMAETLARWAFGSLEAYVTYANDLARSLGMKSSYFADASGFSPRTVSTANDLVLLGLAAINDPTISEITAQASAIIPVAGEIRNTNRVLGQSGIVGVKTGNTDEAGGCFMVAGKQQFGDRTITTLGVIMGAPTIGRAMADSVSLISSAYANYGDIPVATANTVVSDYTFRWGVSNKAYLKDDVTIFGWKGQDATVSISTNPLELDQPAGSQVGNLIVATPLEKKVVPVHLQTASSAPSITWRLKRLIGLAS